MQRLRRLVSGRAESRRRAQAERRFDAERGIETATWVHVPELDTTSPNREHAMRYQPSNVEEFTLLMDKLPIDDRDFTFVDYGSGKGRALLLAADKPFRRIIGVEFSESLHRIARDNVASLGEDASRVELVHMDATEFDPPSGPLVAYFFSPFSAEILTRVLARITDSSERSVDPTYVVITGPPELAEVVEESGFERVDVDELGWLTRGVFLAASKSRTASRPPQRRGTLRASPVERRRKPSPRGPSSGSSR
jgi:SAM-dependent methyltransferase